MPIPINSRLVVSATAAMPTVATAIFLLGAPQPSVAECSECTYNGELLQHRCTWGWKGEPPLSNPSLTGVAVEPMSVSHWNDGREVLLRFNGGRSTLLYVVSPSCGWCKRNQVNANALAPSLAERYETSGLSTSDNGLREYIRQYSPSFPIYVLRSKDVVDRLALHATPQLIEIDGEGFVRRVSFGAFNGSNQIQIEARYALRLPGLTEPKSIQ